MNTIIKNKRYFFITISSVAIALILIRFTSFFEQSITEENVIINLICTFTMLFSASLILYSEIKENCGSNIFISEILFATSIIVNNINILFQSASFQNAFILCLNIAYLIFLILTYKNKKYQLLKIIFTCIIGTLFFLDTVSNGTYYSMACLLIACISLFNSIRKKEEKNEN